MDLGSAPLSSLATIPVTEETAERMLRAGYGRDMIERLSEAGALAALELKQAAESFDRPGCFGSYDSQSRLCSGCLFVASCSGDPEVVELAPPRPPAKRRKKKRRKRKSPPPPPPRKKK